MRTPFSNDKSRIGRFPGSQSEQSHPIRSLHSESRLVEKHYLILAPLNRGTGRSCHKPFGYWVSIPANGLESQSVIMVVL